VNPRFEVGLVVGKFSPLHRGHEYLIGEAIAQCRRLLCISYSSPEKPRCEADARRRWFAELFPSAQHLALDANAVQEFRNANPEIPALPDNDASELEHRVFVAQICSKVFGTAVDAVFTSELYGDGFAAELTRQFRSSGLSSRHVEHVLVDLERRKVTISATALRRSPDLWGDFLSPVVRASLVRRVCLLGGESSGKTTLTRALADAFRTTHAEEYGRELWIERGGELSYEDYLTIATTQIEWEDRAARAGRYVIFGDSSPLTTLLYCLDQFGRADPRLRALAERRYDLTLLCAPDIPFVQDGTRRDEAFRARQHERYLEELERRRTPFVPIEGPLEARVAAATAAMESRLYLPVDSQIP